MQLILAVKELNSGLHIRVRASALKNILSPLCDLVHHVSGVDLYSSVSACPCGQQVISLQGASCVSASLKPPYRRSETGFNG